MENSAESEPELTSLWSALTHFLLPRHTHTFVGVIHPARFGPIHLAHSDCNTRCTYTDTSPYFLSSLPSTLKFISSVTLQLSSSGSGAAA